MGEPFGQVLLAIVAVGLICYSIWRFIQAVLDPDGHGTDLKALLIRGGLMASAVTNTGLAIFSFTILFGVGGSSHSWGAKAAIAWLLGLPFGRWLVGAFALTVIVAGGAHVIKGVTAK